MAKFSVVVLLFLISIDYLYSQNLQKGDLIFQSATNSGFSNAITEATSQESEIKIIHVGIIDVEGDSIRVIEASPEEGVRVIDFNKFLEPAYNSESNINFIVKRLTTKIPIEKVIEKAMKHLGEPYDWWYLPDNDKMYCSELVQVAYEDFDGKPVFKTKPMNFRDKNGELPSFWVELFETLNIDVPEGIEGTNPQDIFDNPILEEICTYPK